jgi:hypothetical protein
MSAKWKRLVCCLAFRRWQTCWRYSSSWVTLPRCDTRVLMRPSGNAAVVWLPTRTDGDKIAASLDHRDPSRWPDRGLGRLAQ